MYELNLREKKDEKVRLLKVLSMRAIPRIGETITYDKNTYRVIDVEYNIPSIGEETINVVLEFLFSLFHLESPE